MTSPWRSMRAIQHVAAVLVCLLVCTSACFLRNCPVGGKKRSQVDTYTSSTTNHRECLRCGPGGAGQCVGPRICCGYVLGCLIDTPETVTCQRENLIPTACRVKGRTCGHTEEGNCVARGICCTEDRCWLDAGCKRRAAFATGRDRHNLANTFVGYIGRLLHR